jgi:hypothetical protein
LAKLTVAGGGFVLVGTGRSISITQYKITDQRTIDLILYEH